MRVLVGSLACFLGFLAAGCGEFAPSTSAPTGGFAGGGATQGGVQDLTTARAMVAKGVVPPAEAFPVEGMLSEYDLPLPGEACDMPLCLRGGLGWEDGAGWVQIGLSSSIVPETLRRPTLGLVLLVDVSGSMGWGYGEYGRPAAITHDLLQALVEEMTGADRVAMVTFASDAALALGFTPGDRIGTFREVIDGLSDGGSTNMEAGLRLSRKLFLESELAVEARRILLLTDAQPNTGATSPGSFLGLARDLSEDGIALTTIGVGMGLDPTTLKAMTDLRGGNGFSIPEAAGVESFLDDNWPYLVTPIAHDLRVAASPAPGFELAEGYGFPGDEPSFTVASVFLSKRRGALLLRFAGAALPGFAVDLDLSYETLSGERIQQDLRLETPSDAAVMDGRWFPSGGPRCAVALALLCDAMRRSADTYGENAEAAIAILDDALQRFAGDLELMADPGDGRPGRELDFGAALLTLMREGARQGDLYGGF